MYRYIINILILLLILSNQSFAGYSEVYDKKLNNLTVMDPQQSLIIAKQNLVQAQIDGNIEKQLVSILYIVESLGILSKTKETDAYIERGLGLANKHNNIRFKSEFLSFKSYQYELKGNYHDAVIAANRALQYAKEVDDERINAEQLAGRGQIQLATENYDLAMKDVEAALSVFKKYNDKENLALNYNLLAIIYYSIDDLDNAIKYYKESQRYDETKSPFNQATIFNNIGSAYAAKEDYDKAIDYYKRSMALSKQNNDKTTLAFTKYGMAEVLMLQKKISQSEEVLLPAMAIFKEIQDELMLFNSHLLLAELKTQNKLYPEALEYLDLAEKQYEILKTATTKLYFLYQKTDYYVAQNMWKEAYELTKLVSKAKNKLQEGDKEKLVSELKVRFNAQFDQEKLELLTKQNKLQQDSIVQEQTRQKYLWGLIGLSLLIFFITFLAYRNQIKIKKHLYQLSITDYLTNVSNRRHIVRKLKKLHQNSMIDNTSFGLVMIDLDYFKKINDNFGHDVGNEVLIYFAKTVKRIIGDAGEVGRIGGEEWLILFPNVSINVIKSYLNELREAYKDSLALKIPRECELSFSSGVIMCTGQYQNHEKILSDVDNAMYSAKKKGREQDVFLMAS